jgi:hypothetical protein
MDTVGMFEKFIKLFIAMYPLDLCHHLKRRGYNDKVIESGLSKASEINRNNLRSTKKKGSTNGSPCFQLPSLFRKKMQASSVIIGKKLKKK